MGEGGGKRGPDDRRWIWCQLGAREHYALPRALHGTGLLAALITDAWAPPGSLAQRLPGAPGRRLGERYDPGLAGARVAAFNGSLLTLEALARLRRDKSIWGPIIARNNWFQQRAIRALRSSGLLAASGGRPPMVFAYSYAARAILQTARDAGCPTILGQIDPGPAEEEIVARAATAHSELRLRWEAIPPAYWQSWRMECDLADRIVVNSEWSQKALVAQGIACEKIRVVPPAYTPPTGAGQARRSYPEHFTRERPLRLLFVGSLILRKGIAELLQAFAELAGKPIELTCVGPEGIVLPQRSRRDPRLHWIGPVPRGAVQSYYETADVFIFPTLSDGFGLTQLEAQAAGLPVIASPRCGAVVEHRVNGLKLPEVTGEAIADAVLWCLANPQALRKMSAKAASQATRFRPEEVLTQFLDCAAGIPDAAEIG